MTTKLIAPRLGEGVEELTVVNWLKKIGEDVAEMEPILEVETDKVVTEFPSPASGVLLEITVPAGESVKVGESMGIIGAKGETLVTAPSAVQQTASLVTAPIPDPKTVISADDSTNLASSQSPMGEARRNFVSPLVRKIAEENHVDLTQVTGTGEGGRITKSDVLAYLEKVTPAAVSASVQEPAPRREPATQVFVSASSAASPAKAFAPEMGRLIPHTSARRQIAERMVQSKLTSPHVLTVMEADMSAVMAHRKRNKDEFQQKGINLTLTPYFIAAIVQGLKSVPKLNASWTDEGLFVFNSINVGMAVALGENGLIVPVIHDAQELSLEGLARRVNDLAERARSKRLLPEDVRGGTFSLTNYGTGGSLFASPVINQPQLGILGTGVVQKRAVVITDSDGNDAIAIRPMVYLSLVFDHRAIDGELGDLFLSRVKQTLENWR